MQTIPFLDLHAPHHELRTELQAAFARVLDSGWFILGQEVEAFEREFAAYCEAEHCVGVGNGLEALHLILRAYGIGPGDEVKVGGSADWAMPPGSASIQARTWARWATAGRWSRMTPNWPTGCGCCATTARG